MWAGLLAAGSLLIDYILTVSVSIAACVEALVSANEGIHAYAVPLAVALTVIIAYGNLRGLRESGTVFSIPTYGFIFLLTGTLIYGLVKVLTGDSPNVFEAGEPRKHIEAETTLTLFLILRAFSSGCTALTGVEAISNGVRAFKEPAPRNAATTLTAMALILGALFLGTTLLARHYGIVYAEGDKQTVMAQIGQEVFGRNVVYYTLQAFTAGILFLAANTAYNGFPLLAALLARDGYLPRIFYQRGNRLVFSWGIFALTLGAVLLLFAFKATTTRLIPLYALGVFLSFTLSQSGMVKRWLTKKEVGWQRSTVINGVGAVATLLVFVIILVTKFEKGGWMVVAFLPVITASLWWVGRFYRRLGRLLHVAPDAVMELRARGTSSVPIIVPVEEINLATVMTVSEACNRTREVIAVHVEVDPDEPSHVEERWRKQFPGIPLIVIDSPYRTVADPIAVYVRDRVRRTPHEAIILVPVVGARHFYHRPLVNQSLKQLKKLFATQRHVDVQEFHFDAGDRARPAIGPDKA
jgi:amino acid transporter